MARARTIRPTFFTHDYLATCDLLEAVLFAGLWTEADRMGRIEDRPTQLKMRILPMRECNIVALLDRLEHADLIARYTDDAGNALIWIPRFVEQQRGHIHPKEAASVLARHPLDTNPETGPRVKGGRRGGSRSSPGRTKVSPGEDLDRPRGSPRSAPADHDPHDLQDPQVPQVPQDLQDPRTTAGRSRSPSPQETTWANFEAERLMRCEELSLDPGRPEKLELAAINTKLNEAVELLGLADVSMPDGTYTRWMQLERLFRQYLEDEQFGCFDQKGKRRDRPWPLNLFLSAGVLKRLERELEGEEVH